MKYDEDDVIVRMIAAVPQKRWVLGGGSAGRIKGGYKGQLEDNLEDN